jgi:hydroxymethylbilane synthase
MKKKKIIVGSRESKLAVIQSQLVIAKIKEAHPEIEIELVTMKTTGDMILDKRLDKIGGKGLFVKELDKALGEGKVDITVHSLKDLPMETPEDLPLVAFTQRENPFDVLVFPADTEKEKFDLPLGTSSMRRELQLKEIYPDWKVESIRGNVITRLARMDRGEFGGTTLAYAGLSRLGILEQRKYRIFTAEEMIPACGQGILAVQGRRGDDYSFLDCLRNQKSQFEAEAERAFVTYLDGGCSSPIGALAQVCDGEILIRGLYYNEQTCRCQKGKIRGKVQDGIKLAIELAKKLKEDGKG